MSTNLERIAVKARLEPKLKFTSLAHHVTEEEIWRNLCAMPQNTASGIDGQDRESAKSTFSEWKDSVLSGLFRGGYQPPPVRRVYIPKPGKTETRPIGIPTVIDRALQRSVANVLNQIYEQDFLDCSYGGRPGRSAHQAIYKFREAMSKRRLQYVFEADLKNFFGSLDHKWVLNFIQHRAGDPRIIRLVHKWLKAGVMEEGKLEPSLIGTPQGGPISVLISNLFLHYVLDLWVEKVVRPRMRGDVFYARYLDDFILCFQYKADALAFEKALTGRLGKFSLTLEASKTKLIQFGRFARRDDKIRGKKTETFSFLGFTFVCSTFLGGKFRVGARTEKNRLKRGMTRFKMLMQYNRHRPLKEQITLINAFLRGHYNYYGIAGNSAGINRMYRFAFKTWQRVLSTRSQSGLVTFEKYVTIIKKHPILRPRIVLSWTTIPPGLPQNSV